MRAFLLAWVGPPQPGCFQSSEREMTRRLMNNAPRNMPINKVNAAITMVSSKFDVHIFKPNVTFCAFPRYL